MSILKRFLKEDLASILRGRSTDAPGSPSSDAQQIHTLNNDVADAGAPIGLNAGMKVVILNWKDGENDPFSVVNASISQHFRACGKNVEVIEISAGDWVARLAELVPAGVEFAFTWQGFGSDTKIRDGGESIWELLNIPLICIHGDHPSHTPPCHQLESRYCFHLYANADFARYSNRYFRRTRGASIIDIPQLHLETRLKRKEGDYFVIAKNINDPVDTESLWKQRLDKPAFDAFMMAAETLKSRIIGEPYVEFHDVLDKLIVEHGLEWLSPSVDIEGYHKFHSQLDHYIRSHKSVSVVSALREFPVRIYGRGWDRVARSASASHAFDTGRNMADSQELFYSRFGLIDVSPSKGLHDRTRRAMANGTAFLSSANLEDSFVDIAQFEQLFFNFMPNDLPEKCAAVVSDPEKQSEVAQKFADTYHNRFHFKEFVNRLDHLANLARRI